MVHLTFAWVIRDYANLNLICSNSKSDQPELRHKSHLL